MAKWGFHTFHFGVPLGSFHGTGSLKSLHQVQQRPVALGEDVARVTDAQDAPDAADATDATDTAGG